MAYEVCINRGMGWEMVSSWRQLEVACQEAANVSNRRGVGTIVRQGNNGTLCAYKNGEEIDLQA